MPHKHHHAESGQHHHAEAAHEGQHHAEAEHAQPHHGGKHGGAEAHDTFSEAGPKPEPASAGADGNQAVPSASDLAYGGAEVDHAHEPDAKEAAMVKVDTPAKIDGKDIQVQAGTYVEVVREDGHYARVRVYSGHHGKKALLPLHHLHQEPALALGKHHSKEADKAGYMQYRGVLWNDRPKAGDVDQGRLNDCYVLAPAAAIAASNPDAIMRMFHPHVPNQANYTVRLFKREKHGKHHKLKPVHLTIDTTLPSKGNLDEGSGSPIYGGHKNKNHTLNTESHNTPLWPLLLEKAFAQLHQADDKGYEAMDSGGIAAYAMEMMTGHKSEIDGWTGDENGPHQAMSQLKSLHHAGSAVCCNTKSPEDSKETKEHLSKHGFHGWHFYFLHKIEGDKLHFKNPWGYDDPKPITAKEFTFIFNTIQAMPKPADKHEHHAASGGGEDGGGIIHGGAPHAPGVSAAAIDGGGIIHGGAPQRSFDQQAAQQNREPV